MKNQTRPSIWNIDGVYRTNFGEVVATLQFQRDALTTVSQEIVILINLHEKWKNHDFS